MIHIFRFIGAIIWIIAYIIWIPLWFLFKIFSIIWTFNIHNEWSNGYPKIYKNPEVCSIFYEEFNFWYYKNPIHMIINKKTKIGTYDEEFCDW